MLKIMTWLMNYSKLFWRNKRKDRCFLYTSLFHCNWFLNIYCVIPSVTCKDLEKPTHRSCQPFFPFVGVPENVWLFCGIREKMAMWSPQYKSNFLKSLRIIQQIHTDNRPLHNQPSKMKGFYKKKSFSFFEGVSRVFRKTNSSFVTSWGVDLR